MDESKRRLLHAIKHYQESLERYTQNGNSEKMLHAIDKLSRLPIQVCHLEETGVGRTVNALKKVGGRVTESSRMLVDKWKSMVKVEEDAEKESIKNNSSEVEDNHYSDDYQGLQICENNSNSDSDKKNKISDRKENTSSTHSDQKHSSKDNTRHSKRHRSADRSSSSSDSDSDIHRHRKHRSDRSSHKNRSESSDSSSDSRSDTSSDNSSKKKRTREESSSESSSETSENSSSDEKSKATSKHRSKKYKRHTSTDSDKDSDSKSKDIKRIKEKSDKEIKKGDSKSYEHRSKHSSKDRHHSKHKESHEETRRKEKPSSHTSKEKHVKENSKTSSSKSKSDHSKKDEKDKYRNDSSKSSKSKENCDMKKSSKPERDSKKESSKSSSDKKKHRDPSPEVSKTRKESSQSSSHNKDKHKKDSEASDSKTRKDKTDNNKKKESNNKISTSKESKPKDHSHKVHVQKSTEKLVNGIDSESGTSFADVLGMLEPPVHSKSKKRPDVATQDKVKVTKEKVYKPEKQTKPSTSTVTSASSTYEKLDLPLLKENNLEPLDINIASLLPTIAPNYKPVAFPLDAPPRRLISDDEAFNRVISAKHQRTKVFSGNKCVYTKVPSLFDMCTRVLQDNLDAMEYTGGVPYSVLKCILEKATAQQLYQLEFYNPYIMEDSDELWQLHCQKEFRNKTRQEMECWREMYMRCLEEREAKLKALTANIKQSQDRSIPVRTTKLAYVDSVVKPPRNVLKKQARNGTAFDFKKPSTTPTERAAQLAKSGEASKVAVPNPGRAAVERGTGSSNNMKPKKAPLMAKSLSLLKNRFGRR